MSVDELGYLRGGTIASTSGRQPDGVQRTVLRRDVLEDALSSYDEVPCLDLVRAGLTAQQVDEIGVVGFRLIYEADPGKSSGAGYAFDKALALAAVEVLEGQHRPLVRKRRRSRPDRPNG